MSQENISTMLSEKGYKVIPVSKEQQPFQEAESDSGLVIMDVNVLKKRGVKTIRPVGNIHNHYSDNRHTKRSGTQKPVESGAGKFLYRLINMLYSDTEIPFRKKIRDIIIIILIGMTAGAVAVFIDSNARKMSGDTIFEDRLDRLIRAVELDWGR